jgi:ketosteroid isomerase-like protein
MHTHPESQSPRAVLKRFHEAMRAKDANALADLYALDAKHDFCFFTPNRPARYEGREAVRVGYRSAWHNHPLDIASVEDELVFDAADPEVVIGQWRAACSLRATGAPVSLTGLIALRVREGKIVQCWDFMDGLGIAHALGRLPFAAS